MNDCAMGGKKGKRMSEYAQTAHKNIIIKNSTFPATKIKATDDKTTLVP